MGSIPKEKLVMEVLPSYFCVLTDELTETVEKILDEPLWFILAVCGMLLPFYQPVLLSHRFHKIHS